MLLYGSSFSPYVRKVIAFAAEKAIDLDVKAVSLGSTDPDFLKVSPFRQMPALSDGDFSISDSSAIVAYLDAIRPDPALIPSEPKARARTIWFEEFADGLLFGCAVKMFFNRVVSPKFLGRPGDLALADKTQAEELPRFLAYVENAIQPSGFLVEDRLTLADIAVANPFVNLSHAGVVADAQTYPKLTAFLASVLSRPSFAGTVGREKHYLEKTSSPS